MNLSKEATNVLNALRSKGYEYTEITKDGTEWGSVYLDNVLGGFDKRSVAGLLSALEAAGLYRRLDGNFGLVVKGAAIVDEIDLGEWEPTGETLDEVIARDLANRK